jgi:hypothetical protein
VFLVLGGGLLLLVYAAKSKKQGTESVRSAILEAQHDRLADSRRSVSLDALRARDPALTEESIVLRVRQMADVIREAWCAGDMRPARAFVSDGVYSRYQVQLRLMAQERRRNVMKDARVLYATIEAIGTAPPLDAVHLRLTAEARDAEVSPTATPQEIERVLSRTPPVPYTEIWTLVRRQGAQTKLAPTAVGKECPSCGAPLGDGEITQCRHCNALVCSAEHDWVLAEITQLEEWRPTSHDDVPGLARLREEDLGAAREVLEDRASYAFWKWIEAARAGTAAPLRKCATEHFVTEGRDAGPLGLPSARDVAVGGADLLLVDVAPADAGEAEALDHAYVRVFWSARFGTGDEPRPMQSVLRLVRRSGTSTKLSMTAVACPSCGAPLAETDSPACEHCGAEVVASGKVWALDAIVPPAAALPRRGAEGSVALDLIPDPADPRERALLFAEMARLVAVDGRVDRKEKRLLSACARRWSIPEEVVGKALEGRGLGGGATLASSSPEWFLAGLVAAALADGTVDDAEMETLRTACARLSLGPADLERALEKGRARRAATGRA